MDLEKHITYWIESADNDLSASMSLYHSGKYDWCLFIGHLVLEKLLKALFVLNNQNQMPPKTHNLNKLAVLSKSNILNAIDNKSDNQHKQPFVKPGFGKKF